MATKIVLIQLDGDMLEAELEKKVTITEGANTFTGTIKAITAYIEVAAPAPTKVTLTAPGLAAS